MGISLVLGNGGDAGLLGHVHRRLRKAVAAVRKNTCAENGPKLCHDLRNHRNAHLVDECADGWVGEGGFHRNKLPGGNSARNGKAIAARQRGVRGIAQANPTVALMGRGGNRGLKVHGHGD
jgi:hypothetical protein